MTKTVALIVAAGRGHRFGGELPKQYSKFADKTVLRHTLEAFIRHTDIDSIQVVIHPDDMNLYSEACYGLKLHKPVFGGATRQQSVVNGLEALNEDNPDHVLIHDAARPFIDADLITRIIASLKEGSHGILPALSVVDTLKQVSDGVVQKTVSRENLWRAQTPQGFQYQQILSAHKRCEQNIEGQNLTDDVSVAEYAGLKVRIIEGSEKNMKITTQDDLTQAKMSSKYLIQAETRTGLGYDVHKFCEGKEVILCGVAIPHNQALLGHSDADVAMHALTDALLGAIGEGDIGTHFPPTDPQWKGASSDVFLRHAATLVMEKSATIINVDVTIICEKPKIVPHREKMEKSIAEILSIDPGRVNIKATTTEKLGFTGRCEGIASQAVTSIRF